MSSGRDLDPAAETSDDDPQPVAFTDCDFVGPLRRADQAWAEHVLRADTSAALFEPADNVIRRREAHISGLYRMASLLALSGDLTASGAAGFRAVAEARALAEFMAASPAYCLDCFLLGDRCQRHQASDPVPGTELSGTEISGEGPSGDGASGDGASGGGASGDGASGGVSAGGVSGAPAPDAGSPVVESTGAGSAGAGSTGVGPSSGSTRSAAAPYPGGGSVGLGRRPAGGHLPDQPDQPGHPAEHQPEWRRFGAEEFPSAGG
jgi:hypothetical protein